MADNIEKNTLDSLDLTEAQTSTVDKFVEQITKSMPNNGWTTGYGITPDTQNDAAALRREFLDDQITMLTWTEGDLSFYKDITKRPSDSTVAKYDVYNSHGRVGHSRFTREIGVAPISDPNITQKTVNMKFISDTKNISMAAGLVNNIQDPMQILTDDAISVVAKTIEWASFYGDASLSDVDDKSSGLEFDGLASLIHKDNIVDARGDSLTEQMLNRSAVIIGKGYGTATDAYMPLGVQAQFINEQLAKQTQLVRDNGDNVNMGFKVQGFNSARGFIKLHGSTVMELENILDEDLLAVQGAPIAPQVEVTPKANKKGRFTELDKAQPLSYRVVVSGEGGDSIPSEAVLGTLTNIDDSVEVKITLNTMFAQRPHFVTVYRQGTETGLYYKLERIAVSKAENNVITFVDTNNTIPETADVFVGEMSPSVVHLFELLPMMRLPLAQINASVTFAVLWYGALALRAPKRWVQIKNVKYIPVANIFN